MNDGSSYKGMWQEGKQHGFGILSDAAGRKKYGVWKNGAKIKTLSKVDINNLLSGSVQPHTLMEVSEDEYD